MPNSDDRQYQQVWVDFVNSVQMVIDQKSRQSGRAYLRKYYYPFAEKTRDIVREERFAQEVAAKWLESANNMDRQHGADLLFIEVKAYPELVKDLLNVKKSNGKEEKKKNKWKDALRIAKTILESLKDLLNLSEWGKIAFKFYLEGIDIFKG